MKNKVVSAAILFSVCFSISACFHTNPNVSRKLSIKPNIDFTYDQYLAFFEEVYSTMNENYYKILSRDDFDNFVLKFKTKIYPQLKDTGKSIDFIKWRSTAFLIDNLKDQEDVFSAFYPPKPAKEYEEEALGVRKDLGIEGKIESEGFVTTQVEPRSDSYQQGLRIGDIIESVDDKKLALLTEKEIQDLLTPLIDSRVKIKYLDGARDEHEITVLSMEYYKQTVFVKPIPIPGIYCLEVKRFNRKTSEDMLRFLQAFKEAYPIKGLILDLRGNPGGPPLAAREISSFFLSGGEDFAYFMMKGREKALLDVPVIPNEFKYEGPIVILVDKDSGSASELFSGILQKRGRAILMGENSAGQVMLKSMFHFSDESMLLLVTARGHHPDGSVFSFGGLVPDRRINKNEKDEILKYAASYLVYMNQQAK